MNIGGRLAFAICAVDCPVRTLKTMPGKRVAERAETAADGAVVSSDAVPAAGSPATASAPEHPTAMRRLASVYFQPGSVHLDGASRAILGAALLRSDRARFLRLTGCADSAGDAATNERLAARRAEAVARLIGVTGSRAVRVAPVELATCYAGDNATPSGRQRNRRVDIDATASWSGTSTEHSGGPAAGAIDQRHRF